MDSGCTDFPPGHLSHASLNAFLLSHLRHVLWLALPMTLAGCILLPLPSDKPESAAAQPSRVETLVGANETEVMQRMGEPSYRFTHAGLDYFLYEAKGERQWLVLWHPFWWLAVVPPAAVGETKMSELPPPVSTASDVRVYCALLEFGADDSVQRVVTKARTYGRPGLPCTQVLRKDVAIEAFKTGLRARALDGNDIEAATQLSELFDDREPLYIVNERAAAARAAAAPSEAAWRKRAEQGEVEAQLRLYWNGAGPSPLTWLCRAADQGHLAARSRLASLHELGREGLPRDPVRAHLWYTLAGEQGQADAQDEATRLATQVLSSGQLEQARRLRAEWRAGQCEAVLQRWTQQMGPD